MNAVRLDRLPRQLTALFALLSAIGLVVLASLAIIVHADKTRAQLDDADKVVTSTVLPMLQVQGQSTLVTGYLNQDPISGQCPQFAVIQGGAGSFPTYYSKLPCLRMDPAKLGGLAHDAAASGQTITGGSETVDGKLVEVRAEPFRNKAEQYIGAVVAVTDAGPAQDAHDNFALIVIGGVVVLLAIVVVVSYLVSSRWIKPAVAALAQRESLLDDTAHDLRKPVAALRSLAEAAMRNPARQADLLPRAVKLAEQMGVIIDNQLTRARLAAGVTKPAFEPVWLDQLVVGLVEDTPKEGASVTVTAAESRVTVDPDLVRRAVRNLLENALRYGRHPDQQAFVHITVANGRVTVADHGPGVDPSIADELLDRFRTGGGSTGLGLSIVSWVALVHGGRLDVYNAKEGGAIFDLVLRADKPKK